MQPNPKLPLFASRLFTNTELPPDLAPESVGHLVRQAQGLLPPHLRRQILDALTEFLTTLALVHASDEQLQTATHTWLEAQTEMFGRLQEDRAAIEECFGQGVPIGRMVDIHSTLSDPHQGLRSAAILTFESGLKVVYKPREMALEDWYVHFLSQLNELGAPLPFGTPAVLDRVAYGWMEFVPHMLCQSVAELAQYYRNAGALLCVLHLLRATDCHFQNVIASHQHPILIDAEMLFQPQLSTRESSSVTRTGFIPAFRFGPQGQTYEISALGFVASRQTHFQTPVRIDGEAGFAPGTITPVENLPFPPENPVGPQDYVEEMVDGFRQTWYFLAEQRQQLTALIETAATHRVRYLVRETMQYYQAFDGDLGLQPEPVLPVLPATHAVFAPLRESELAALRQFDIPRYTLPAASRSLAGIGNCFVRSGLDCVLEAVEQLDDKALESQVQQIRLSWSLSAMAKSLV